VKRSSWPGTRVITLNKIGETFTEIKDMWISHQAERPAHLETHEQLINRAMALAAELEGTIIDREMVAIFELFIRDLKMVNAYANMTRKEWQQVWVENHLVELGLCGIVNNPM